MKTAYKTALAAAAVALVAGVSFAAISSKHYGRSEHRGRELFKMADTNSDGAVASEEFIAVLDSRFKLADANNDMALNKAEIITAAEKQGSRWTSRHAGRFSDMLLRHADINDNGSIERSEFDSRARKHFALMDFNDDGKVEFAEIGRAVPHRLGKRHGGGWRMHDRPLTGNDKAG